MPTTKQLKQGEKIRQWIRDQKELPTAPVIAKRFRCKIARASYYLTQIRKEKKTEKKKKEYVKPRVKPELTVQGGNNGDDNGDDLLHYRLKQLEEENKMLRNKIAILKELV